MRLPRIFAYLRWRVSHARSSARFDAERNTNTGGIIPPWLLGIGAEQRKNAVRYQATEPEVFALAMTRLPINPENFSFVDIGCGKGRTLILAHERRFRRIIGVEVSSKLARIARSNCPFAEIVESDALSWNIPSGPLVIFMFNPFGELVMREVANRIRSQKDECFVIYINPTCRNCFSSFQTLYSSEGMAIWRV